MAARRGQQTPQACRYVAAFPEAREAYYLGLFVPCLFYQRSAESCEASQRRVSPTSEQLCGKPDAEIVCGFSVELLIQN